MARALDALATALAGRAKAHEQAEREAAAQGFASLAEAREAVLDAQTMAELETAVQSWASTLAGLHIRRAGRGSGRP